MNGLTELIFNGVFDKFHYDNGFIVLTKYAGCVTQDDIDAVLDTVTDDGEKIPQHMVFKADYQVVLIG